MIKIRSVLNQQTYWEGFTKTWVYPSVGKEKYQIWRILLVKAKGLCLFSKKQQRIRKNYKKISSLTFKLQGQLAQTEKHTFNEPSILTKT